jgi:glucosamine-6-phosphate deaminase
MALTTLVFNDKQQLGAAAAAQAAAAIQRAIAARGRARILAATGASQFEFLDALVKPRGIDWSRVEMFHLDEYFGLAPDHPASFQRYLLERLIRPTGMTRYHLLAGDKDPAAVCRRVGGLIRQEPIDVAFVGIGENGHLAFNDPPADFETREPYLIVELDEACRRQQVGEGWFASLDDVPTRAISISIRQILDAREIVCVVPDARKAWAVKECLAGPVTPTAPASILQTHPNTTVYLDTASAALLPHGIARAAS